MKGKIKTCTKRIALPRDQASEHIEDLIDTDLKQREDQLGHIAIELCRKHQASPVSHRSSMLTGHVAIIRLNAADHDVPAILGLRAFHRGIVLRSAQSLLPRDNSSHLGNCPD